MKTGTHVLQKFLSFFQEGILQKILKKTWLILLVYLLSFTLYFLNYASISVREGKFAKKTAIHITQTDSLLNNVSIKKTDIKAYRRTVLGNLREINHSAKKSAENSISWSLQKGWFTGLYFLVPTESLSSLESFTISIGPKKHTYKLGEHSDDYKIISISELSDHLQSSFEQLPGNTGEYRVITPLSYPSSAQSVISRLQKIKNYPGDFWLALLTIFSALPLFTGGLILIGWGAYRYSESAGKMHFLITRKNRHIILIIISLGALVSFIIYGGYSLYKGTYSTPVKVYVELQDKDSFFILEEKLPPKPVINFFGTSPNEPFFPLDQYKKFETSGRIYTGVNTAYWLAEYRWLSTLYMSIPKELLNEIKSIRVSNGQEKKVYTTGELSSSTQDMQITQRIKNSPINQSLTLFQGKNILVFALEDIPAPKKASLSFLASYANWPGFPTLLFSPLFTIARAFVPIICVLLLFLMSFYIPKRISPDQYNSLLERAGPKQKMTLAAICRKEEDSYTVTTDSLFRKIQFWYYMRAFSIDKPAKKESTKKVHLIVSGILILSSLTINIFYHLQVESKPYQPDTYSYINHAENMLNGEPNSFFNLHRTPVYPLLLIGAKLLGSFENILWIQVILGAFSIVLCYVIIYYFTKDIILSAAVSLVLFLHFEKSYYQSLLLTEGVIIPILLLSLLLHIRLIRKKNPPYIYPLLITADILLIFLKPTFFALPVGLLLLYLLYNLLFDRNKLVGKICKTTILMVIILLSIAGWAYKISEKAGTFLLMSDVADINKLGKALQYGYTTRKPAPEAPEAAHNVYRIQKEFPMNTSPFMVGEIARQRNVPWTPAVFNKEASNYFLKKNSFLLDTVKLFPLSMTSYTSRKKNARPAFRETTFFKFIISFFETCTSINVFLYIMGIGWGIILLAMGHYKKLYILVLLLAILGYTILIITIFSYGEYGRLRMPVDMLFHLLAVLPLCWSIKQIVQLLISRDKSRTAQEA